MSDTILKLDLRETPMFQRHPLIFDKWEGLKADEVLQITNDHDPRMLKYQLESEQSGKYTWEPVTEGPSEWVVNIKKLKGPVARGEELKKKVLAGLDKVRPHLVADGGDVELVEIDEERMVVKVRLTGACGGCPSASMTLKSGVEAQVRKAAPEIEGVEPV
ncbi:MAG TPA: hypothetical protein DHU82_07450 [Deltaproteobacteria bacterium]|nr:hypothetical protein [Deltaproteobacteria bacterium]